jgi:predicted acyltransferase
VAIGRISYNTLNGAMSYKAEKRIVSLDAFRGITIAFMILVNNPGSWSYVYSPLRHAQWHGCTPTDLVFPLFLFIVGTAMRFSFSRYDYEPSLSLIKKIVWRSVTIFVIGILLNAFPFVRQDWDWTSLRVMGVLQRIGIAYGLASLAVLYLRPKILFSSSVVSLLIYWMVLLLFGTGDPYSLETNAVRLLDLRLLGPNHLYMGTGIPFDPLGILSTLPAVVTVIIGYAIGRIIQKESNENVLLQKLISWGSVGIVSGIAWGLVFPINKQLWTSSYVLYTGGIGTLFMAFSYWLFDMKNLQKVARPFVIFGTNSIFVYAASILWAKTLLEINFHYNDIMISGKGYLYKTIFQPLAGDFNGSLLFALSHVLAFWLLLYWMYRKKIFVKI